MVGWRKMMHATADGYEHRCRCWNESFPRRAFHGRIHQIHEMRRARRNTIRHIASDEKVSAGFALVAVEGGDSASLELIIRPIKYRLEIEFFISGTCFFFGRRGIASWVPL